MKDKYLLYFWDYNDKFWLFLLEFKNPVCQGYFSSLVELARQDNYKCFQDKKFMDTYGIKSFKEINADYEACFSADEHGLVEE